MGKNDSLDHPQWRALGLKDKRLPEISRSATTQLPPLPMLGHEVRDPQEIERRIAAAAETRTRVMIQRGDATGLGWRERAPFFQQEAQRQRRQYMPAREQGGESGAHEKTTACNPGRSRFGPSGSHLKANEAKVLSKNGGLPGKTLFVSIPAEVPPRTDCGAFLPSYWIEKAYAWF